MAGRDDAGRARADSGFTFKWNMGWMHDTLAYFAQDPIYRRYHQDQLTFAMMYEYSEHFIMPLSHDEVVHLKGSLLDKMPGDEWQKLANLRAAARVHVHAARARSCCSWAPSSRRPTEWNHDASLDWHLRDDPQRAAFTRVSSRGSAHVYRDAAGVLARGPRAGTASSGSTSPTATNSVLSYVRRAGDAHAVVVLNLTPMPRERYRIGVPERRHVRDACSRATTQQWGGSGYRRAERIATRTTCRITAGAVDRGHAAAALRAGARARRGCAALVHRREPQERER